METQSVHKHVEDGAEGMKVSNHPKSPKRNEEKKSRNGSDRIWITAACTVGVGIENKVKEEKRKEVYVKRQFLVGKSFENVEKGLA